MQNRAYCTIDLIFIMVCSVIEGLIATSSKKGSNKHGLITNQGFMAKLHAEC